MENWSEVVKNMHFSSASDSLGDRHSVSPSCSWNFLKLCFGNGGEPLSKRASLCPEYLACRQREIESRGKPSPYFRINKQQRQLSKERTKRQTKKLVDCVNLQNTQKSWRSETSFKQSLQETARVCSAYHAEKLTDQPVLDVDEYFEEFIPEVELDRSKK